ncbi:MAG: S8 family serine peptidase [Gammaproteobacteria bacterium]|nr:S8 family serine peptidase [Gammaproteobacteria bacterium]
MVDYTVNYGGERGKSVKLAVSEDYVVVRTHKRTQLNRTNLSKRCHLQLAGLERIVNYEDAGVEVYRVSGRGEAVRKSRNQIRSLLKREDEVSFAGRALCDKKSKSPVVYTENFFVKFSDDVRAPTCRRILKKHGLKARRELGYATNAYFASAEEGTGLKVFAQAKRLLREGHVELCHPELIRPAPRRAASAEQWHLKTSVINGNSINQHAHVEEAWRISEGGNITIAVIDDGFDLQHEEFSGSLKVVAPYDATRDTNNPWPGNRDNHGTACAGVACANGLHQASGVAPKAKLMPIRLASALGSQDEADAFEWAADHGADVISCSWGPPDGRWWDDSDPMHSQFFALPDSTRLAIDYAVNQGRSGKGCVVTWAAGNGNESVENDGYASYVKVIAVGACNDQGERSAYSDIGQSLWCCFPSSHGMASLTPGIWTTDRSGAVGYSSSDYTDDFGGTSSACPGAAGTAALILSHNPELRWDEVKDVIKRSCDRIDVAGGDYDSNNHSPKYGYGRINTKRALQLALPAQANYKAIHTAIKDVAIRDMGTSSLKVAVGDTTPLSSMVVHVDIEHTYIGDLIVRLVPPSGSGTGSIVLHDRAGSGQRNLKSSYDAVNTPGLQSLTGLSPMGSWMLRVTDNANRDTGTIKQFSLEMSF